MPYPKLRGILERQLHKTLSKDTSVHKMALLSRGNLFCNNYL
jgi:hypothetical protein